MALTRILSLPKLAGEAVGQADDAGLGGGIGDEAGAAEHPGDRGEVDDRAAAELAHLRAHGLGGEELVAEVHVDRAWSQYSGVTASTSWRSSLAALLTSTPIGPSLGARPSAIACAERGDVGQVAADEERPVPALPRAARQAPADAVASISTKATLASCPAKACDHRGADAGAAAGDEDDAVREARIVREGQGHSEIDSRRVRSASRSRGRTGRPCPCRRRA